MTGALGQAAAFIVLAVLQLFIYAVLLRFILQAVRANFYNPITQMVVKVTDPVLRPLRRLIPGLFGLDMASLLLTVMLVFLYLVLRVNAMPPIVVFDTPIASAAVQVLALLAPFELLDLILGLYFVALLVMVVVSWVAPTTAHPGAMLVYELCEPVLRPVRRLIPPMGGLDLSVLVVFLLLTVFDNILMPAMLQELLRALF